MGHERQHIRNHMTTGVFDPVNIDWASPKQAQAFMHPPTPLCCSGGFGAAKTYALAMKALWLSDQFPGNRGLIARKVWEDLKRTTMSTFFKICRPEMYQKGGKRVDSDKYLRLNNGSEILWAHMDDPETENVIRGIEINWVFLDQGEEIDEAIWDLLLSRLGRWDQAEVPQSLLDEWGGIDKWPWKNPATGVPQVPPYAMLTCNPADFYHWIYRRFHEDSDEHYEKKIPILEETTGQQKTDANGEPLFTSYKDLGYTMIHMASYENKFLPLHNLAAMMQRDESFRKRFIEGRWGITEGTIHEVDPLSIIETDPEAQGEVQVDPVEFVEYLRRCCTLHRTLDHGDSSPTSCGWFAVDKEGNIFAFREYYVPNRLISYHRARISEMSEGEYYKFNQADPSIFFKTQQKYGGRWSVADEYKDPRVGADSVLHWQPADNNEMGTRNRISEYLTVVPDRIHPITKERGAPRLFFVKASDCYPYGVKHMLRELRAQTRMQIGTDNGRPIYSDDRNDKNIPDHAYDLIRYMVSSRPPVATEPVKMLSPDSFEAVRRRMNRDQPSGRMGYLARKVRGAQLGTY